MTAVLVALNLLNEFFWFCSLDEVIGLGVTGGAYILTHFAVRLLDFSLFAVQFVTLYSFCCSSSIEK
jgi:hypothetical protein